MIPLVGTIKSAVKIAELDAKWQQKKDAINQGNANQLSPEAQQIQAFREDLEKMRENDEYAGIYTKIQNGKKLSPKEIEYLQKNDPQAYTDYKNAQAEKEAFKRKLRDCETKEDVRKLKVTQMGNYLAQMKTVSNNPNIPDGKKLEIISKIMGRVNGIEEVYKEFVSTAEYGAMKEAPFIEEEKTVDAPKKDKKDYEAVEDTGSVEILPTDEYEEIKEIYNQYFDVNSSKNSEKSAENTVNTTNNATLEIKCDS